jgi:hypothetical protein
MVELSLAVVGIDYLNADRSNRRMELLYCRPGDPVQLRPEPKNKHDPHAVAVFSERGIQVGYLSSERAPLIGARIRNGELLEVIFQDLDISVTYIRARFGGGSPTLPATRADHFASDGHDSDGDPFPPDPDGPEWGA